MIKTISTDELKQKIDRKDDFLLVETPPADSLSSQPPAGSVIAQA